MLTAVRTGRGEIVVRDAELPDVAAGDVRLEVHEVGICGGDLHAFLDLNGQAQYPKIVGHECVGQVVEVGAGVSPDLLGTRVVVDPQAVWCGTCEFCENGARELCRQRKDCGYALDGLCAEYVSVPAARCYAVPGSLQTSDAVNTHALAGVLRGMSRVSARTPMRRAVIFGSGPAGLLFLQVTRQLIEMSEVGIVGRSQPRLDYAHTLGADVVLSSTDHPDLANEILQRMGGQVELVVETSGSPQLQSLAIDIVAPGGTILLYAPGTMNLPTWPILEKAVTIQGTTGVTGQMQTALNLLASGRIKTVGLISHKFALAETQAAFEHAVDPNKSEYIKGSIVLPAGLR